MAKSTKEIEELQKEQDHLLVKKAHIQDCRVRLEEEVSDACHHILKSIAEPNAMAKAA